jgi:hypothetical protein
MTIMAVVIGGIVFGILLFRKARNDLKTAEKRATFKGIALPCPHCASLIDAESSWVMSKPMRRLELFECATCGKRSKWNMRATPPEFR